MAGIWQDRAACIGYDPDLWFPDGALGNMLNVARGICNTCPVARECLAMAFTGVLEYGMFGGLSANQRRSVKVSDRVRANRHRSDAKPCGTMAAVRRHYRRKEQLDETCRQAVADHSHEQYLKSVTQRQQKGIAS